MDTDRIIVTPRYGRIWIEPDRSSATHSFKCTLDYATGKTTRERIESHYVCIGIEKCMYCGKKMED